MINRSSSK